MTVDQLLNDVEQSVQNLSSGRIQSPDRFVLLDWLNIEFRRLISIQEWDWALIPLNTVSVGTGSRTYKLPEDFGTNFARYSDLNGDRFMCIIVDSNNIENFIHYKSPAQFFGLNLSSTTTGKPNSYTIIASQSGLREIWIDPLPDATYTLRGLYIPTSWKLDSKDQYLPLDGNNAFLKNKLLERIFAYSKDFDSSAYYAKEAETDRIALFMNAANSRRAQFVPVWHDTSTVNRYQVINTNR